MNTQQYRSQDAQEILQRALARPTSTDAFSHDQLQAMAAELDIDAETLDKAAAEWRAEQEKANARRRFIAERRRGFLGHLIPYLAVNTGLIVTNIVTDRTNFWAIWPLMGWGIGLLSHGLCALRTQGTASRRISGSGRPTNTRRTAMTDDPLLPSKICTALMRLGTRLATGFDQQFASLGITQAQFRVLLAVCEQGADGGGLAPSALADYLLIERATVSVLSGRLLERGLLARTPGANRRTFLLSLTAQGRETLAELIPRAIVLADETLTGVPPESLLQIWETLATVEARLRSGETPPDPP